MKRSARYAISAILLIVGLLQSTPSANAAWLQYQSSPKDSYNGPDLTAPYDITEIDFAVSDTEPNEYWFFLNFSGIVTSSTFADGLGSSAGIDLDLNLDGKVDYSLMTSTEVYKGNSSHSGRLTEWPLGSVGKYSSLCNVVTWTNLDKQATWIGFSIPKTCLPIGTTLGIRGYAHHNIPIKSYIDLAPDNFWNINVKGGAVISSGSSSSNTLQNELPSFNLNTGKSLLTKPSNPPNDLVALAASTKKSVVTVFCGDELGSGWSINASLSAANISNGYKSYIITNQHVIESCTTNRNIFIALSNQVKVPAYVYTWDEANDVAGILTSTYIEPLDWLGSIPQQGWWLGVIGSPLGFPGILTTGIISSINTTTFLGTTNAAINPGNSGGPVFDRNGRVIGLATAKYIDSEGFGIFHGTPLLCVKVIKCESASQIWNSATTLAETAADAKAAADKIIEDAKAAADKIIEDAKAAVDKATADKIIADAKATADKIIADAKAAVEKKTTITCIKGKLTKKITAVKPKCPAGYKKK